MITCIAIDDEPLALKQIESYISKLGYMKLVGGFTRSLKALEFLQDNSIDLMFVDINMPDLSGLEFVKSLSNPPKVIFTTAYREYAVEGFEIDAADYLVKPISFASFCKSVEKTKKRYFTDDEKPNSNDDSFIFVKSEYKIVRIELAHITYIEAMGDYIRIHLDNEKPIMALSAIKKILEQLPKEQFMRVHRSYIINLSSVDTVERNRIIFDKDTYIPISEGYREGFQKFIEGNFLK